VVEAGLPVVAPSPAEVSHSGTPHSLAPIEKWRDLFASNHNTISCPKHMHFSSSCSDSLYDLSSKDLDNNYDI
jgi:hypothetical protein